MIQPTLSPTLPVNINETETHASVDKDKPSKACILSVPALSDQNAPLVNEKVQNSPHRPDRERTLLSTSYSQKKALSTPYFQDLLPLSEHHDFSKKGNKMDTMDTEKMDTRRNELVLPVRGTGCVETLPHPSTSDITVLEPQSPILGAKRIVAGPCSPVVRTKKGQIKSSSPILGSCKVPKRKLTLCDGASAKRQINRDDISINSKFKTGVVAKEEEHRNVDSCQGNYVNNNYLNSNARTRNLNDVHEAKLSTFSQSRAEQNEITQSQHRNLHHHLPIPSRCSREEQTPSRCSVDLNERIILLGSCDSQGDSKTSDDFKPLALSDISPSQGHLGLCVDDCASQSIAVPSEGTNSQLDLNIEAPLTPCKNSLNSSDICEVSTLSS